MVSFSKYRAGAQDAPLILQLAKEIWLPTFAPLFGDEELRTLFEGMYNDAALHDVLTRPSYHMYVLCARRNPTGYMGLEPCAEGYKLDKIYIHPILQRTGMGAWALAQAEAEARDAGHRSLCLRVNRRNTHAIAFYLHKGFTIDAQADYPAPNGFVYDDYLMSKIMA